MAIPWYHLTSVNSLGICWSHWSELFNVIATEDYMTVATNKISTLKNGLKKGSMWGLWDKDSRKHCVCRIQCKCPRKHWGLLSLSLLSEEDFIRRTAGRGGAVMGEIAKHAHHRDKLPPFSKTILVLENYLVFKYWNHGWLLSGTGSSDTTHERRC